jgi:hypothetical protein
VSFLRWLWGCHHDFRNTGEQYTDRESRVTVVIRQCRSCNEIIIIEV